MASSGDSLRDGVSQLHLLEHSLNVLDSDACAFHRSFFALPGQMMPGTLTGSPCSPPLTYRSDPVQGGPSIYYGVKVKSCITLAPEIFTDEGVGSWVAYTVVGVWPEP